MGCVSRVRFQPRLDKLIDIAIEHALRTDFEERLEAVRAKVHALTSRFPVYR